MLIETGLIEQVEALERHPDTILPQEAGVINTIAILLQEVVTIEMELQLPEQEQVTAVGQTDPQRQEPQTTEVQVAERAAAEITEVLHRTEAQEVVEAIDVLHQVEVVAAVTDLVDLREAQEVTPAEEALVALEVSPAVGLVVHQGLTEDQVAGVETKSL